MNNRTCLVTELVPKWMADTAPVSIAAHHFCYKLIDNHIFDDALSLAPITIDNTIDASSTDINTISFRKFPHKSLFRLFNAIVECVTAYFKLRKYNAVWFYNLNIHNILLFLLIRYLSEAKACVILADYTPEHSKLKISYWIGKALWQVHAILSLSARTEYRKHRRFDVIPGILTEQISSNPDSSAEEPYCLFSGVLGSVTGIELALECFAQLPDIKLVVTGKDESGIVSKYAQKHTNIEYRGFVSSEEYNKILNEAAFCLNFRNPELPENQNNFPSKMLEYLNHGKLVISTMQYPELDDIPYISAEYSVASCMKAIHEAFEIIDSGKVSDFRSPEKVQELCSPITWKAAIQELSK